MTVGQSLVAELRAAHAAVHKALDHLAQAECDANDAGSEDALRRIDFARKALIRAGLRETIEVIERAVGVES